MNILDDDSHLEVLCAETQVLGDILWYLLRASARMDDACYRHVPEASSGFFRSETTAFGFEVAGDEIHWWVFMKEDDLALLRRRSTEALQAADRLKSMSAGVKRRTPASYDELLRILRGFSEQYLSEALMIREYLSWLHGRSPLAPSILFTYRVWGSTRRGDRTLVVGAETPEGESGEMRRALVEAALGLRTRLSYNFDEAVRDLQGELYEQGDFDAVVREQDVVARASREILDEFAIFFEWIRNSLRNVLLDIEKCESVRNLMRSDIFWGKVVLAAAGARKVETQLWEFKETLNIWHTKGEARNAAKVQLAEDVAAFANAGGGVLILGIADNREILGIDRGMDVESNLKAASDVLAERLDPSAGVWEFRQVVVATPSGRDALCLAIVIANTVEPIAVSLGQNNGFSYPVRRESGLSRVSRAEVAMAKGDELKGTHDFVHHIAQFLKDVQGS